MKKLILLTLCLILAVSSAFAATNILPLPTDFSGGPVPDPAAFTESGYTDDTITVEVYRETRQLSKTKKAVFNVAHITISDPSQLRVGLAKENTGSTTNNISAIARSVNAVLAIGGDYFGNYISLKGGYVVRMGDIRSRKPIKSRDMLVIDSEGNFHIIVKSDAAQLKAILDTVTPVNVFNFGPALIIDGAAVSIPKKYEFNPDGVEPRCAIGQIGPLEYLCVMVDGRISSSDGCRMETLASFMLEKGCVQAYNLDGGNSALMYFNGSNYSKKSEKAERSVSDIIYFATGMQMED